MHFLDNFHAALLGRADFPLDLKIQQVDDAATDGSDSEPDQR